MSQFPAPAPQAAADLEGRLAALLHAGVVMPDPRQVFVGAEVELSRIHAGAVLHPGTRIGGARTVIGPGAVVGSEGPAVLDAVALDAGAEVASGYVAGAALLRGARVGANAHVRPCTILEEEASTAHAVGLKHTVLMSFATLGSLINFCDGLLAGGTSRKDHTEVGSGFIHFNFTPWGETGDKATPTLVGDVMRGALLDSRRVFLGGLSGIVGPRQVGFGAMLPAGQVLRRDTPADTLQVDVPRAVSVPFRAADGAFSEGKDAANRTYLANLAALRAWYAAVRLPALRPGPGRDVVAIALDLIDGLVAERVSRWNAYRAGFALQPAAAGTQEAPPCPMERRPGDGPDHVDWLRGLSGADRDGLEAWLRAVGQAAWAA